MPDQATSIDHRELARKSLDRIKVFNPSDKDFTTYWDGFPHIIPAKGFAIKERYIADKYLQEKAQELLISEADTAVKDENQRRMDKGMARMDHTFKTGEQLAFETPYYVGWEDKIKDAITRYGLYGGVVERYGMAYVPSLDKEIKPRNPNASLTDDLQPAEDFIVPPLSTPTKTLPVDLQPSDILASKGVFELRSIAKNMGIETEKTNTKEELLAKIQQHV